MDQRSMEQEIIALQAALHDRSLTERLRIIAERYPGKVALSSALGKEAQLLSHYIFTENIPIRIFTIDTGRLFEETYELHQRTLARYKGEIEVYYPQADSVQKMVTKKGPLSFYDSVENRKECCGIRKVEPLKRALQDTAVWMTGVRKGQSDFRKGMNEVEYAPAYGVLKFNPLLNWTAEEVQAGLDEHNVPYNSLHRKGFASIGCAPCTRAILEGEDSRAGRWWWESSDKECGLHAAEPVAVR